MPNGLTPFFTTKYVRSYEIFATLMKPDVYTLKLSTNFVAHLTFHVLKLKLFMRDEQRLDYKQKL
jgi:hypothetical protein